MNSVTQRFLETLNDDLLPVRGVIERFAPEVNLEPATGALRISHRPKVGAEAYACVLYPGVDSNLIDRYERIHRARIADYLDIPLLYRNSFVRQIGERKAQTCAIAMLRQLSRLRLHAVFQVLVQRHF